MIWILQKNKNNYFEKWLKALKDNDSKYHVIEIEPFSQNIPQINVSEPTVVIGTTSLIKFFNKNWIPGVFFDTNQFKVSTWQENFKEDLLNHDGILCKLSDLKNENYFKEDNSLFIRPNDDLKDFSGVVVNRKSLIDQIKNIEENPKNFSFNSSLSVFISKTKHIQKEFRFFVVNGKIVDACQYRLKSMLLFDKNLDQNLLNYAEKLINIWKPAKSFVMDIALTDNNEYKLLEFNCINGSGLYICDPLLIVKAIEQLVDNNPEYLINVIDYKLNTLSELMIKKQILMKEILRII